MAGVDYKVKSLDTQEFGEFADEDVDTVSSEGNSPIARITPSMPKVGVDENITFSATDSTDLDGDELTYSWSFEGDGMVYSNSTITRSYSSAGEYKVTLSVTDSTGLSDEAETTVKVVSNYQETFEGSLSEGQSDVLSFTVEPGAITLLVNWSLDDLRPYVANVLDLFSHKRLMFGTDWPVCTLAASYASVVQTALCLIQEEASPDGMTSIFRDTAIEFYRLDAPESANS